jgi:hypothetical protein
MWLAADTDKPSVAADADSENSDNASEERYVSFYEAA